MKTLIQTLVVVAALPVCAYAQGKGSSPLGRPVFPTENIVIFSAPPSGALTQANPQAILSKGQDLPQLFPLKPSDNGEDYVVASPLANSKDPLEVASFRDIVQGKQVNRWLELQTQTTGESVGWVLFGTLGQDDRMLQLGEKQ